MSTESMAGKVALVTGGSRGIGRAICEEFAARGAFVYINYAARKEAADETLAGCRSKGGDGALLGFDVAASGAVDEAFDQIKAKSGKLDILVNNAGIAVNGLMMRMSDDDWRRVLETNLSGAFYCARAAAKMMMKARVGRIINISSVVGEMGNAGQAAYVSSKAGLLGLTKSMARELASRNITVNAITPGFIETDMTSDLDPKLREEHFKAIPLGRYGGAQDIAAAAAFLASDAASYVTGQVLGVNGGMYM